MKILSGGSEEEGNWAGRVDPEKLQALNDHINEKYQNTKSLVTISNDYLAAPALYSIQLKIRNFLGEEDQKTAKVEKTKKQKQPIVSISGAQTIKKMRPDPLSLFA